MIDSEADGTLRQLLEIMARLRDPVTGCPWDREQDFHSISCYTLEEAYEVADAIRRGDMADLKDELGDLLFQVVFYAQMAKEQGSFDFTDVVDAINRKMIRRHPHVFGEEQVADAQAQTAAWERLKAAERRSRAGTEMAGELAGVAQALPALMRAEKLQKRAAKAGLEEIQTQGVPERIRQGLDEIDRELGTGARLPVLRQVLGDLLFSCVNLARQLGLDAEQSLRQGNDRFEHQFRCLETLLRDSGQSFSASTPSQLQALWDTVRPEQEQEG